MKKPTDQAARFLDLIQKDKFLIASSKEDKATRELILNYYKSLCNLTKEDVADLNSIFPNLNLK